MAAAQPAEAKQLRLFATLDGKQQAADGSAGGGGGKPAAPAVGAVTNPQQRLELLAAGSSSKWSPFYAVSARHDMHTTALLTHCISLGHQSSGQLAGFDRDLSRCGGCEAGSQDGQLAAALAEQLVPGWRALTRTPGWRWHLQARPGEPNNPLHCPSRVPSQPPRHRPRSCQPTGSYENMKFAWRLLLCPPRCPAPPKLCLPAEPDGISLLRGARHLPLHGGSGRLAGGPAAAGHRGGRVQARSHMGLRVRYRRRPLPRTASLPAYLRALATSQQHATHKPASLPALPCCFAAGRWWSCAPASALGPTPCPSQGCRWAGTLPPAACRQPPAALRLPSCPMGCLLMPDVATREGFLL